MRAFYSPLLAAVVLLAAAHADAATIIPLASDGATVSSDVQGPCAGCGVTDEANVISDDLDAYATMSAFVGVGGSVSLNVTFPDDITRGAKAGFRIGTGGLLDVGVLSGLTVTTYLDGAERDSGSGGALITLQLLSDGTGYAIIRTKKSFDEVRIEMGGLISVDTDLRVYHALAIPKRNRRTVTDVALASEGATVDSDAGGLVCLPIIAPCEVYDEANVISDDLNAAATMSLPVGVAAWSWVDVTFPQTYDVRGKAGFIVRDAAGLFDIGLLETTTLTTYLGDTPQETATSDNDLRVVVLGGTKKAVFFTARQPFDRVRLSIGGLAELGMQMKVYYAVFQYTEALNVASLDLPETASSLTATEVLSAPAPNPATDRAALALSVDEAQTVRVDLFDVQGRLVATPFDGHVEAGASAAVSVDTRSLPAGVYLLRATGETVAATRRLTVAR